MQSFGEAAKTQTGRQGQEGFINPGTAGIVEQNFSLDSNPAAHVPNSALVFRTTMRSFSLVAAAGVTVGRTRDPFQCATE